MRMKAKACQFFFLTFLGLCLTSCQKSCGKQTEGKEPEAATKRPTETKNEQENPLAKLVNFDGLTETQISSVSKMFNEEVCPCGCPVTFAQCLAMKEACKPASLLANWAVKQLKEGAPEFYLFKAISEELGTGFLAAEKKIDTLGAYQKGNAEAPHVIVEFADFECPACRLSFNEFRSFQNDHKDDVQVYFMHFPLSTHPNAERAAIAAEAAGKQGKFWEMHDLLFTSSDLSDAGIDAIAQKLFSTAALLQFKKDLKDPKIVEKIKLHKEYGMNTLQLVGTPTYMFNGRPYNLSSAKDGYELRLLMENARKDINCQATK